MSVTREYVDGSVAEIFDADTGTVVQDGQSEKEEFMQRGAQVEFKVGDKVTYLRVTLPNGKRIVREVGTKG